jgi:hypothetical protein
VSFIYQAVERIPKQPNAGVVYHSEEFEVAALLCACGCGHRVMLLVPDSHQVTSGGGMATVRPSIAVCDAPCKSHYVITAGRVAWLPAFRRSFGGPLTVDEATGAAHIPNRFCTKTIT